MSRFWAFVLLYLAGISVLGCGGRSFSSSAQQEQGCAGLALTGRMMDSLTGMPVSQGWAVLESGTPVAMTPIYNFEQIQRVKSDSTGAFQMCSSSVANPAIVVLVALDSSGKAYPPFIAPLSNAAGAGKTVDLGTIRMGGCTVVCGLEGQEQTSETATLKGRVISTPAPRTGSVVPEYAMYALDGTKNLWNILMPVLDDAQTFTFKATALGCPNQTSPCATYTFTLSSQKPVWSISGGYQQQAGAPVYSIDASADPACSPASVLEFDQQDGTPLIASPGSDLQVSDIDFTNCQ